MRLLLRSPMDMDGGGDSGAGDALAGGSQVGDSGSQPVTVPMDMLPGCKVGDTYTVKSVDGENVTLEAAPAAGGMDDDEQYTKDAVAHVAAKGGM
jgi:hypothetical protein